MIQHVLRNLGELKQMVRKYFLQGLISLYVLSFLLPYMRLINVESSQFQSHFGFELVRQNWVIYLILVFLLMIYLAFRRKNRIYSIFVGTAFTIVLIFSAVQILHLDASNFGNSLALMGKILLPGFYVSSLLGLTIGIFLMNEALNLPLKNKKENHFKE